MDEGLRGKLNFSVHIDNKLFYIKSIGCPEIQEDNLWLRGSCKEYDNFKFKRFFDNKDDRDRYISRVKQAFEELKIYLREQFSDDYTEPTMTIINKDEKESDKIIDDVKEDEYEYLTAESLKEILNGREEYITNTIIKTIDKAIREKVSQGYDQFPMLPEDFKVSIENKEIKNKVTEHFSNIGIDIEWDVKTMSLPICNVKVVK
jgi:hypothetical protein